MPFLFAKLFDITTTTAAVEVVDGVYGKFTADWQLMIKANG